MTIAPALHLGVPTHLGALSIFPVWTDAPLPGSALRGLVPNGATIGELSGGSIVQYLQVKNPTTKPFLLPGGTIFDGGWQARALVHTTVVPATADMHLDVRCVEAGRWAGGSAHRVHQRRAPLAVRGALRGARRDRPDAVSVERRADQGDVWRRVDRYQAALGTTSSTSSLITATDHVERTRQAATDPAQVRPLLGQRGVLLGLGGHPAVLEVFDHPRTLADQWDALLSSVAADAQIAQAVPTTGARARTFAARVSGRRLTFDDVRGGDGSVSAWSATDDLAIVDGTVLDDERMVHLAALNVRHDLVAA